MELEFDGLRTDIDDSRVDATPAEIRRQIDEYRAGTRRVFDLPVDIPDGFVGAVMEEMLRIPYGEVRTYGDIAERLDTAPVAVGGACGRNPVGVIVPCHRVVGHDSLGGYSADGGTALKRWLLDHEGWGGLE